MSNSHLIKWFEEILFGSQRPPIREPTEVHNIILRMESENIPWFHMISQGGLTLFPYQVHGDINSLLDYLEKQWIDKEPYYDPPIFKTRAVSKFWDQLQLLLARRLEPPPPLPNPSKTDAETLKEILEPTRPNQKFSYESAEFWGEVARRFINLNRPEDASTLPNISSDLTKRAIQLYDITSRAQGMYYDPYTYYLVHDSEYVDSVHWRSGQNLEAFMHHRRRHPLTLSIQAILKKSLNDLLNGKKPSVFKDSCPQLDSLLHNIKVIHEEIEQVPHENQPPKLIDVFQRLLALCKRDGLWENQISEIELEPISTSLLHLTERVQILEREKRILWKHVIEDDE